MCDTTHGIYLLTIGICLGVIIFATCLFTFSFIDDRRYLKSKIARLEAEAKSCSERIRESLDNLIDSELPGD